AINTDALRLIEESEAHKATIATFQISGKNLSIAIQTPNNQLAQDIIADFKQKNYIVTTYLCSETSLTRAWELYAEISQSERAEAGVIEISEKAINQMLDEIKTVDQVKVSAIAAQDKIIHGGAISGMLETILAGALSTEASDIHIEPQDAEVRLRYRLDGVLQDILYFDKRIYQQILSRIKLVSGLRLNIKQMAQDGRFSIRVGEAEIEIRTSILPGNYGESIVMRVLNPKNIAVEFESLGVDDHLFSIFDREIKKPNGMILLTGPTGSGKTTTLYAFLKKVNDSGTKIITIEDPVEYHLKGVSQTQVNAKKGYTFLSGLRSALRQDPDIIMVGEIRDAETAKIAINAALTGHLVFSTLHTNNAAGAIPRLIDLGVNPKIISSALTLPIAQRLIRKLCNQCKQEYIPKEEERKLIEPIIPGIKLKKPDMIVPEKADKLWKAVGCIACNNTGYKGRQGIFEAIEMDKAVAAVTVLNPSEREIKQAAIPQGVLDMRQDGIVKVLHGITSLDDLGRVVDLYEEVI
ncbi:MAG: GspE/PulE family protein, partial [bacterium]